MRSDFDENYLDRSAGLRSFAGNPMDAAAASVDGQSPLRKFLSIAGEAKEPGSFAAGVQAQPVQPPPMQPPQKPGFLAGLMGAFIPGLRGSMENKYQSDQTAYVKTLPHAQAVEYMAGANPDKYLPMMLQNRDPLHQMQVEDAMDSRSARAWLRKQVSGGSPLQPYGDAGTDSLEGRGRPIRDGKVLSSAEGKYQYLDGTWLETVRKHAPQMAGYSDPEILALKTQEGPFKEQMHQAFTEDNRHYLAENLGREPSKGEVYLAHQQGAPGAVKLLSNPQALAKDVVGLEAVQNNLHDKDLPRATTITAGEFAQKWIGKREAAEASPLQKAAAQPQQAPAASPLSQYQENLRQAAMSDPDRYAASYFASLKPEDAKAPLTGGLPSGQMWDETGKKAIPIPGVQQPRGDFKEYQLKDAAFADRMRLAESILAPLEDAAANEASQPTPDGKAPRSTNLVNTTAEAVSSLPSLGLGEYIGRSIRSPEQAKFKNAADEWIRSKLRKESGAVIGESEMATEYNTYFPRPGDGPQVIAQKKILRQNMNKNMIAASNGAYEAMFLNKTPAQDASGGWSISEVK